MSCSDFYVFCNAVRVDGSKLLCYSSVGSSSPSRFSPSTCSLPSPCYSPPVNHSSSPPTQEFTDTCRKLYVECNDPLTIRSSRLGDKRSPSGKCKTFTSSHATARRGKFRSCGERKFFSPNNQRLIDGTFSRHRPGAAAPRGLSPIRVATLDSSLRHPPRVLTIDLPRVTKPTDHEVVCSSRSDYKYFTLSYVVDCKGASRRLASLCATALIEREIFVVWN